MEKQSVLSKFLLYFLLIVLAIIFLIPFYVLIYNAIVSDMQIISPQSGWLPWPTQAIQNFKEVINHHTINIQQGLVNSLIVTFFQVVLGILVTMLSGYALARIPSKRSNFFLMFILLTLMVPEQLIFIPTYVVVSKLKMINTFAGLIAPGIFYAFNTIMFRQSFLDFPKEIEESGFLDGLTYIGIFFRLVIPNSKSIIVALSTLSIMRSWNAFLWPLIVGQDPSKWTVQVTISSLLSSQKIIIHQVFMAGLIVIIPMALIFLLLQKHLVKGIVYSGIKG